MRKLRKSKDLQMVFESLDYTYENMYQLMTDTINGVQEVSAKEANDAIRGMMFKLLELEPEDLQNEKLFKRAMKHNKQKLFEVIEDVVDDMLVKGWEEDPFFMQFVETKNLADGDHNEFWTEEEVNLAVAEVSGDHHDIYLQRLGEGESYSVKTSKYGAAVGTDIRLYLAGRRDFTTLINAITKAFDKKIKDTLYKEVAGVGEKLPCKADLSLAIELTETTKPQVDKLIEMVSAANGNCDVTIMGVSSATKKLDALTKIDWVSEKMKDAKHETGRMGWYEGTSIVEIPQRVTKTGKGQTARLKPMIDDNFLLVLPTGMDRFVKFVNKGDAEIVEVTEQGARQDDMMTFEYQQGFGIGTQVGKYFGFIKITA